MASFLAVLTGFATFCLTQYFIFARWFFPPIKSSCNDFWTVVACIFFPVSEFIVSFMMLWNGRWGLAIFLFLLLGFPFYTAGAAGAGIYWLAGGKSEGE